MNKNTNFIALHNQEKPLLLGNVWDAHSASLFEQAGYQAVGTSSAAIASSLGLEDGEHMTFQELEAVAKSITSKISIPLTVDIEGGYSREVNEIIMNISTLHQIGASGVNIEDSTVDSERKIFEAEAFGTTVRAIRKHLDENNIDIFLNVRIDPYIMGLENPLADTLSRIKIYEEAGADGVFVPCIVSAEDIEHVVAATKLPINVMSMPDLPNFQKLTDLGIRRISMGPFVYNNLLSQLKQTIETIHTDQSFSVLFKS